MTVYLTIITTLLVITQIIRVTQNAIQLRRQEREIRKTLDWFDRNDVSETDFDVQRKCFNMLHDWLEYQLQKIEEEQNGTERTD